MQRCFPQGVLLAVVALQPLREVMQSAATQRQTASSALQMRLVVIDDGNKCRSRPISMAAKAKSGGSFMAPSTVNTHENMRAKLYLNPGACA